MQFLSIGVKDCADNVIQQISKELEQLKSQKIDYSINEINSGGLTSIVCSVRGDKVLSKKQLQLYDTLRVHISNALADYIIRQYEEKLIKRIINSNYCYFNAAEKKDILDLALCATRGEDKKILSNLFQIHRYNTIVRKLLDYFESSNNLILDGFVNFRLKEYMKDLEDVVDKAVDDFLMEREYREFIRLLRYFVEIQEPKFDVIHIFVSYENRYVLLDQNRKEITNECIQEFVNEVSGGEINYDDLLISSLITLAPRKITIHAAGQFRNKELLGTIRNVFSGKVVICSRCELCEPIEIRKQ